jgi:predicted secreted hydrolase
MSRTESIPYREADHGGFDEEWLPHRRVSEWWYVTGAVNDAARPERLFSFQATFIRPRIFGITPSILQLAVTDVGAGRHTFVQRLALLPGRLTVDGASVSFGTEARLEKRNGELRLEGRGQGFAFDLRMQDVKAPVWHGDNGVLVMGLPGSRRERTVYYSRTNLRTSGTLETPGPDGARETIEVTGQSWFDRQWGPYSLLDPRTGWEWFSLRFFDDEEAMLFAFPQDGYYDGTFVDRTGGSRRLRDYSYEPLGYVTADGFRFSRGWDLVLPGIKAERYRILPLVDGQVNLSYFELLAEIVDPSGRRVGMCIAELLPGARNPRAFTLNILRRT